MDFVWIVLLITAGLLIVIGLAWLLDWALFDDLKASRPDSAKPSPSRPVDEADKPSRLSRLGELRELIEANKKTGPLGKETLRTVTVPTKAAEQTLELPTLKELTDEEILKKAHPHNRGKSEVGEVTLRFDNGTEKTLQAVIFEDVQHEAVYAHVEPGDYKSLVGLTSSQGDFSRVTSVKANPLSVSGAVCIRADKGIGVPEHEHELPDHEHEHEHDEFGQIQNEIDDIKLQVEAILEPATDNYVYEYIGENQSASLAGQFSVFTERNKVASFLFNQQDKDGNDLLSFGEGDILEFHFAESDHEKPDSPIVHTWVVDTFEEEGDSFKVQVANKAKNSFELDETYQLKVVHKEAKEYDHTHPELEYDDSAVKDAIRYNSELIDDLKNESRKGDADLKKQLDEHDHGDYATKSDLESLEAELELLAKTLESGQWDVIDNPGPRAGEMWIAFNDLNVQENQLVLNNEDVSGTSHGWSTLHEGDYVELIDKTDQQSRNIEHDYGLFVVKGIEKTASHITIDLELYSSNGDCMPGETFEVRILDIAESDMDMASLDERYIKKEASNSSYKDWLLKADGNKKNPDDFAPKHSHPYASSSHTHSDVASHTHNYASSSHTHNYASSSHSHSYASTSHSHSGYASSSHSHTGAKMRSGTSTNPSLSAGELYLNTNYKVIYVGT
jgi:hypothetical protein